METEKERKQKKRVCFRMKRIHQIEKRRLLQLGQISHMCQRGHEIETLLTKRYNIHGI